MISLLTNVLNRKLMRSRSPSPSTVSSISDRVDFALGKPEAFRISSYMCFCALKSQREQEMV